MNRVNIDTRFGVSLNQHNINAHNITSMINNICITSIIYILNNSSIVYISYITDLFKYKPGEYPIRQKFGRKQIFLAYISNFPLFGNITTLDLINKN